MHFMLLSFLCAPPRGGCDLSGLPANQMLKAEDLIGIYVGRGQDYLAKDGTVVKSPERPGLSPARIAYTKEGMVIVVSTPADRAKVNAKILARRRSRKRRAWPMA